MRSQYPFEKSHLIISDLVKDGFVTEMPVEFQLEDFLTKKTSSNSSLFFIPLALKNKSTGKMTLSKTGDHISITIVATNNEKGISYQHDPKHFPFTPDADQLNNYLEGSAILLQRLSKSGEPGDYFIQAIPKNYNRVKIKHLKLHPLQTYLMVSNNYLNVSANKETFQVGGRMINEEEALKIKKGFNMIITNPWFFVKAEQSEKVQKIKTFGLFSFSIDLLKKSYKSIEPVKPSIEPEFLSRSLIHFVNSIKSLINNKNFEGILSEQMEQSSFAHKNAWNYLFNHIIYAANSAYIKNPVDGSRYLYPYKAGYDITVIANSESVVIHPQGTDDNNTKRIVLTDPVSILDTLKESQQISDVVYDYTLEQISQSMDKRLKM